MGKKNRRTWSDEELVTLLESEAENYRSIPFSLKYKVGRHRVDALLERMVAERGWTVTPRHGIQFGDPPKFEAAAPKIATIETEKGLAVESESATIKTLEDLIAACAVDLDKYRVKSYRANAWGQNEANPPTFQVRAEFVPCEEKADLVALKTELLEDLKRESAGVGFVPRRYPSGKQHLQIINLPDLHIGKSSADGSPWGIEESVSAFLGITKRLLERGEAAFGAEKILLVLGNDLVHADNMTGLTTAGTNVQPSHAYRQLFTAAKTAAFEAIKLCREYAPVDVVIVPGNHDAQTMVLLGEVVEARFHDDPSVSVDNGSLMRKYYRYGKSLFGFTHGDKEKIATLPQIMALETPMDWAVSTERIWMLGHLHTNKSKVFQPSQEINGVMVRHLPSICPQDLWHANEGYVGNLRAAETFLHDRDLGLVGSFREVYRGQL